MPRGTDPTARHERDSPWSRQRPRFGTPFPLTPLRPYVTVETDVGDRLSARHHRKPPRKPLDPVLLWRDRNHRQGGPGHPPFLLFCLLGDHLRQVPAAPEGLPAVREIRGLLPQIQAVL